MIPRRRVIATLITVAGLALSCRDSTGIYTYVDEELRLPPGGDRDVSKLAGTYVHPRETTSQLILLASGGFTTRHEASGRTYSTGGTFVRVDSNLVLSFTGRTGERDLLVSAVVRADTILVYAPLEIVDQVPLFHFSFVRVREP